MRLARFPAACAGVGLALLALPAPAQVDRAASAPAAHADSDAPATDPREDPTRPLTRFDSRLEYQKLPGGKQQGTWTLRADRPFRLASGWKLNARIDLPLSLGAVSHANDPTGTSDLNLNDVMLQGVFVPPPRDGWTFGFGGRVVIPAGSQGKTNNRWKFGPTVTVTRHLPAISSGSSAGLLVRDSFSVAGANGQRGTNVLLIQPQLDIQLHDGWLLATAPEVEFNTHEDWKVFMPFDLSIEKKLSKRFLVSLSTDIAVINSYQKYDWKSELRIGYFF